jgi:folate-binding protein YgfZ
MIMNLNDDALDAVLPLEAGTLSALGLLKVSGADAGSFLQGQLTQDVQGLPEAQARWAGYCSAKGRLTASGRLWRAGGPIWWAVSADLIAPLAKRLSMFVLRAKAKVEDVSGQWLVLGVMGAKAHRDVARWMQGTDDSTSLGPDEVKTQAERAMWVGLPAVQVGPQDNTAMPRSLLVVDRASLASLPQAWLGASDQHQRAWAVAEVLAAVPRIMAQTAECFVPQMVNFESVEGVSFTKGCYPGQEVVARSQYLGKLRRRMFLGEGQGALPAPGSDIFSRGQTEAVGQVVMSAPAGNGFVLQFECRTDLVAQEALYTGLQGGADGDAGSRPEPSLEPSPLKLLPLPYALKAQD